MNTLETIEGVVAEDISYHYDAGSDVLYLCRLDKLGVPALGEETDDGLIERRDEETEELVGLTIVLWWQRFGDSGELPDSLDAIAHHVEPLAEQIRGSRPLL